nr:hypothetical protein [Tanacetum cinerariifolium]
MTPHQGANQFLQINKLDDLRLNAYESSISYKERTKKWNDKRIKIPSMKKEIRDMRSEAIELCEEEGNEFTINKQRVKFYQKDIIGFDTDNDVILDDEGEVM